MSSNDSHFLDKSILESSQISYNGYSFCRSIEKSQNCSLISSNSKVFDKIRDLEEEECLKETRLQLSVNKSGGKTFKGYEHSDKQIVISPEPAILQPRIGWNIQTIRKRNLNDYLGEVDEDLGQDGVPTPQFIDEFLEGFDTSK